MEKLFFDRRVVCDYCGHVEICALTHYGTTNYTRLVCLECAMSINDNDRVISGSIPFDLNNSHIKFRDLAVDITKEQQEED